MSYHEKNNYVELLSTLVVFGFYFTRMFALFTNGDMAGENANMLLGQNILWLLGISVVVHIVGHIVFATAMTIITKDHDPSYVIDERDKLIELKGMRVGYYVLGGGFVCSMIVLAMGYETVLVFNLIVAAFALGSIGGNITRIALYRLGV